MRTSTAALVIDTLASGGADHTPRWQRMYCCILLGFTATLLLAFGLVRQTSADPAGVMPSGEGPSVGERVKRLLVPVCRADIVQQIARNGEPALQSVQHAMEQEGWTASGVDSDEGVISLAITAPGLLPFVYRLAPRSRPLAAYIAREAPEGRRSLAWLLAAQVEGEGLSRPDRLHRRADRQRRARALASR